MTDLDEPTRATIATAFLYFMLGLAIAGFVGALVETDLRRERNEARAECVR